MGYLIIAVIAALFIGSQVLKKKMSALKADMRTEKEAVFKFVSASKEPLKAQQIGDSLGILDAAVYQHANELVSEKRIGVMVTQDFVQGRRIRIVQYHALPS